KGMTIVGLFEEQVSKSADRVALVFGETELTYGELNEHSNRLAHYLRENCGLRPGDLAGVMLDRSHWMVIAILGILKSGAAYVPIDPEYPQDRKEYIKEDSNCKVILDDKELEHFSKEKSKYNANNPLSVNDPDDLAYVIYTSGSTGKPKGVLIEHKGLLNRIDWMWNHYDFKTNDIILQKTTITFDVSVWELFLPLCFGAKMVVCKKWENSDSESILSLIEKQKVTCLHFVPSMLDAFIIYLFKQADFKKKLSSLSKIFTSGEALHLKTIIKWYNELEIPIENLYGPTEASIDVTYYKTSKNDTKIPIGKPISNTQIYILSTENKLCPLGVTGEIYIAGTGLARGYLNQPELSSRKFVPNPFNLGKKMYRTGDLGKWLPDGNIEFLGRNDDQVKIRGYRIELGEIESALQRHSDILSCAVMVKQNNLGEKELVAYTSGKNLDVHSIRKHLSKILPAYMIPSNYVSLEKLPSTSNGKIDRNKLLDLKNRYIGTIYVAPKSKIEKKLAEIWGNVLGKQNNPIGIKDDFFALGGDSIKVIQIISLLKLEGYSISAENFLLNPTLKNQAEQILKTENNKKLNNYFELKTINFEELNLINVKKLKENLDFEDIYPLSPIQKVMIEENENDILDNGIYHFVEAMRFHDDLFDLKALEKTITLVVDKHPVLRTVFFRSNDGGFYQYIKKKSSTIIKIDDITHLDDLQQTEYIKKSRAEDIRNKFTRKGCGKNLIRFKVFVLSKHVFELMISAHHSIIDGWSNVVLQNELMETYLDIRTHHKPKLIDLPSSYKEHVFLSKKISESKRANAFWDNEIVNLKKVPLINRLNLKVKTAYHSMIFDLAEDTAKNLKDFSSINNVSLRAIFLKECIQAMKKALNLDHLPLGVLFNGRTNELSDPLNTIGLFWNILPFNVQTSDELDYVEIQLKLNKYEEFSRFSILQIREKVGFDPNMITFNYTNFHNIKDWSGQNVVDSKKLPRLTDVFLLDQYHHALNIHIIVDPINPSRISIRFNFNKAYLIKYKIENTLKTLLAQLDAIK
ncbi:non-ribosomal peptide synthetase, partial [Pedobacter jeongneungensis]|uniref:non-ribosomal peptide synthetase n=1 Tax=Pedobacter jeongneungensis TaxID=947309 RepID=UPI0031F0A4AA